MGYYKVDCQECRGTGFTNGYCQRCSGEGEIYVIGNAEVTKDDYDEIVLFDSGYYDD